MNPTACEIHRLLANLAAALSRAEVGLAREFNLSASEAQCLCFIHSSQPASIKDLSRCLNKGGSQLSRILDSLEDRGIIVRALSRKDRRFIDVALTPAGKVLGDQLEDRWSNVFQKVLERYTPEKTGTVTGFLKVILELNIEKNLAEERPVK